MCTHEDSLAHISGAPYIDDVTSQNELTTILTLENFVTAIFFGMAAGHSSIMGILLSF